MMRLVLLVLVMTACNVFRDGTVAGRLESKGEAGTWVLATGKCSSGEREHYFGAIAYGPEGSGVAVKLVKDAVRGWNAIVNIADSCKGAEAGGCRAVVLAEDSCKKLEVDLHTTNTTVNEVRVVEGKASIDCNGLQGELTFDYCH